MQGRDSEKNEQGSDNEFDSGKSPPIRMQLSEKILK